MDALLQLYIIKKSELSIMSWIVVIQLDVQFHYYYYYFAFNPFGCPFTPTTLTTSKIRRMHFDWVNISRNSRRIAAYFSWQNSCYILLQNHVFQQCTFDLQVWFFKSTALLLQLDHIVLTTRSFVLVFSATLSVYKNTHNIMDEVTYSITE